MSTILDYGEDDVNPSGYVRSPLAGVNTIELATNYVDKAFVKCSLHRYRTRKRASFFLSSRETIVLWN